MVGKLIYARLSVPNLPINAQFYLENLISYDDESRSGNSYHIVGDFCKTTLLDFEPTDGSVLISSGDSKELDFEFRAFIFQTTGTFYLDGTIRVCTFTGRVSIPVLSLTYDIINFNPQTHSSLEYR